MSLTEAELNVASSLSCASALCDFGHNRSGDGPAGGPGDERRLSAPAGKQRRRRRGAGAVCLLRSRAGEALRPGAGGGQQGEVAPG